MRVSLKFIPDSLNKSSSRDSEEPVNAIAIDELGVDEANLADFSQEEAQDQFGHILDALAFGAPPHGGCAAGIDRIVMLLADEANIREVIMFPMNQRAEDLMMNAPSEPMSDQMMELGLRVIPQD